MEVIESGTTKKTGICDECECKFSFTEKDIKRAIWSDDYFLYIECPECGKKIKKDKLFYF